MERDMEIQVIKGKCFPSCLQQCQGKMGMGLPSGEGSQGIPAETIARDGWKYQASTQCPAKLMGR